MSWRRDLLEQAETDPRARQIVECYHRRPAEELYYLSADPHEMHNVVDDPVNAATVADLRLRLDAWMKRQGDQQTVHHQPYLLNEPKPGPLASLQSNSERNWREQSPGNFNR